MRRLTLPCLSCLALAASCSFPQHIAKRTVEDSVPAAGLTQLDCRTHNGSITIKPAPGTSEVIYRVEMAVRGYTTEEAESNLSALRVTPRTTENELMLNGEYDASVRNMSPSFSFVVEVPPELAARLESHNGTIQVANHEGAVNAETHNGRIRCSSSNADFRLVTHNGNIELDLSADGPLEGRVMTHNGSIQLGIPKEANAAVTAQTHNGHIKIDRPASAVARSRGRLECHLGDGSGSLFIRTHNGSVVIR